MPEPYYQDELCTIYHGDCREIVEVLSFDLMLVDPPYGIKVHEYRSSLPKKPTASVIAGDDSTAVARYLLSVVGERDAVIWGANNFPELLPHKGRWTCWDKRCDERADRMLGSAFELAWENRRTGYDVMIRKQHGGVVNADRRKFPRQHTTQKPVFVMGQIIARYRPRVVCDPCMGSGTTLLAAQEFGCKSIGIEIEERYCEIAANRLRQACLPFHGPVKRPDGPTQKTLLQ